MTADPIPSRDLIFISYARVDRDTVAPIVAALRARGAIVWDDPDTVRGGGNYVMSMRSALERSRALVVFHSAASASSPWVEDEIRAFHSLMARETGLVIIPVRLDDTPLPLSLATTQPLDARAMSSDGLAATLLSHTNPAAPQSSQPAASAPTADLPQDDLIFVSYARADRARVEPIIGALRAQGLNIWDGDGSAHGHSAYVEAAHTALRQARALLVFHSTAADSSPWVQSEIRAFHSLRVADPSRAIIPIILDGAPLPTTLSPFQSLDAHATSPEQVASRIVAALTPDAPSADETVRAYPDEEAGEDEDWWGTYESERYSESEIYSANAAPTPEPPAASTVPAPEPPAAASPEPPAASSAPAAPAEEALGESPAASTAPAPVTPEAPAPAPEPPAPAAPAPAPQPGPTSGGYAPVPPPYPYGPSYGATPDSNPLPAGTRSDRDQQATTLERVTFTSYYPKEVEPQKSVPLLVYLALDDAAALASVAASAAERLAGKLDQYRPATADQRLAIPRGARLRIIPRVAGFRFNPEWMDVRWEEDTQQHEFAMRAVSAPTDRAAEGSVRIYQGLTLRAEIPISIFVAERAGTVLTPDAFASAVARAYRRVFASYSHHDTPVVESCEAAAQTFGDRYLRDVITLQSGQRWNEELMKMIAEADIFQLFWSKNAAASSFVQQEWEYALKLLPNREGFIRPVYWSGQPYTIPRELNPLHFEPLDLSALGWGPVRRALYALTAG